MTIYDQDAPESATAELERPEPRRLVPIPVYAQSKRRDEPNIIAAVLVAVLVSVVVTLVATRLYSSYSDRNAQTTELRNELQALRAANKRLQAQIVGSQEVAQSFRRRLAAANRELARTKTETAAAKRDARGQYGAGYQVGYRAGYRAGFYYCHNILC